MSLRPAHIAQPPYLYPVGNTPAVCFTDNVPPEMDTKVLLLGCGDVRSVLFTTYSGLGSDNRELDFTCCDLEAEIIARNAVALTLIANDKDGAHLKHIWNIYYHMFLDSQSMTVLQEHVKSLLRHTQSLQTWHEGPYAALIRFCDDSTFEAVVKLWKLYAIEPSSGQEYTAIQALLKDQWKAAQPHQKDRVAGGLVLDGLRAAAPMLSEAYTDVAKHYRTFWSTGTCHDDKKTVSKLTVANPMFGCLRSGLILHYGLSPLTGFHLAPVHARVAVDSPLNPAIAKKLWVYPLSSAFQVAFEQFAAWCNTFRKSVDRVTIRFVNADAIAFCHVLQHYQAHGQTEDAHWYRSAWSFEKLVLDQTEYAKGGSAPVTFNVIDTSNLMDHLGSLNLLTAAGPLLDGGPISTLRTEMLLPREANVADSAKQLLCGDLPTVASLLGLKPIQYWTNATNTWNVNETLLRDIPGGNEVLRGMCRPVILWKPLDVSSVQYDPNELARFIYGLYLEMHSDESLANRLSMVGLHNMMQLQKKLNSYEVYTRASLAALLQRIRNLNVVDWTLFIRNLVAGFIWNDSSLTMGPHHLQSFCVYLDVLSVAQLDQIFDWWHPRTFSHDMKGPFRTWNDIPPILCVSLMVPRKAVSMFNDLGKGSGTPLCQMQLQSTISGMQSNYPGVQMAFGTITASGKAFTNGYRIAVTTDAEGWKGESPLIVSTMVSTCALVQHGDTAGRVVFQLRNTPSAMAKFQMKLGMFLHLHESAVGQQDVFITRYPPNMRGYMSVGAKTTPALLSDGIAGITIRTALTSTHVESCQIHCDIRAEDAENLLKNAAFVFVEQSGPFELRLIINSLEQCLKIPFPLKLTAAKTRIARKQAWIEFTAPVASLQSLAAQPNAIFPLNMYKGTTISLIHLPYVHPDSLPKLQTDAAAWLAPHTAYPATMSGTEYQEYEKVRADDSLSMPGRLGVKETLHSMYMHMTGLRGLQKANLFCLTSSSGILAMILVDCIRMDLSHQTVFLDAGLLPPQSGSGSGYMTPLVTALSGNLAWIKVNEEEALFWKHLLPTFAERCRQWEHKDTCEYRAAGCIPISTEADKPFMCTCGTGIFPKKYLEDTKRFKEIHQLAVRVAIPVIFSSPISNDDVNLTTVHTSSARASANRPSGARVEGFKPKKDGCLKCGAQTTKAGNALLKCAKCKTAQYCSPDCQKKDWKKHKQTCKQTQDKATGDDAA